MADSSRNGTVASPSLQKTTEKQIASTSVAEFASLLHPEGCYEVRSPNCPSAPGSNYRRTASGYFTGSTVAGKHVAKLSQCEPAGIYLTLNPVDPSLLARAANKIKHDAKATTKGDDILCRRWVVFDIDSIRPAGISATDAELGNAQSLAMRLKEYLSERGWPDPVLVMSGNGYYLIYRVDLPNSDETTAIVRSILHVCGDRFDTKQANVDRSTFDPNRIIKIAGTYARKGDDLRDVDGIDDRPHRQSYFLNPCATPKVVPESLLRELADEHEEPVKDSPKCTQQTDVDGRSQASQWFSAYIAKMDISEQGQNGSKRMLTVACEGGRFGLPKETTFDVIAHEYNPRCAPPWSEKEIRHKIDDAYKKVQAAGEFGSRLQRDRDARREFAGESETNADESDSQPFQSLDIIPATRLFAAYPKMREPIIEGVLRCGEVGNFIAAPKTGKSWLGLGLASSLSVGGTWLGKKVVKGRTLLIDLELHRETISQRLSRVVNASFGDADMIDVVSLRGKNIDINRLQHLLANTDGYALIIIDALYRSLPRGTSENDNAGMMSVYNAVDRIAGNTEAAIVVVHHTSKGDQSGKGTTDIGSGAGSISRAADTHLAILPHELEGCAVVKAVTRSFMTPDPITIKFDWPLWVPKHLEPEVKRPKSQAILQREAERKRDAQRVIDLLADGTPRCLTDVTIETGFKHEKVYRLIAHINENDAYLGEIKKRAKIRPKTGKKAKFLKWVSSTP